MHQAQVELLNKLHINKTQLNKILISLLLAACVFLAHFNWLDTLAEDYTEQGIKRTLITYGITRSLNGVISVAQGTEVAVSPAGIGLNFAPGQILDPVNDLIERFSWVVLASGTSLGIQRLFLEITTSKPVTWFLTILIVFALLAIWIYRPENETGAKRKSIINKILIVVILVRFSIPLIAVVNEALYISYLQPKYEQAQEKLEQTSDQIKLISDSSQDKYEEEINPNNGNKSLFEKAERWFNTTKQSLNIDRQMESLKHAVTDVSQQVINMIVVFVVQTLVFPLLFLWLLVRGGRFVLTKF